MPIGREPDESVSIRAEPECAVRLAHRDDEALRKDVASLVSGDDLSPLEPAGSARGPDPDPTEAVLEEGPHVLVRKPVLLSVAREDAVHVAENAAAVRPDPQGSVPALEEAQDRLTLHRRSRLLVENGETHAVEAREPLLGADPEIAVPRLPGRPGPVFGETFVRTPGLDSVLGDRLLRVERERFPPAEDERREERSEPVRARDHWSRRF